MSFELKHKFVITGIDWVVDDFWLVVLLVSLFICSRLDP